MSSGSSPWTSAKARTWRWASPPRPMPSLPSQPPFYISRCHSTQLHDSTVPPWCHAALAFHPGLLGCRVCIYVCSLVVWGISTPQGNCGKWSTGAGRQKFPLSMTWEDNSAVHFTQPFRRSQRDWASGVHSADQLTYGHLHKHRLWHLEGTPAKTLTLRLGLQLTPQDGILEGVTHW